MNNLDHLTYDVQRLTAALNDANADVALLTRLRDAETIAKRLTVELGQAQDALAAGMTAKVLAQREASFARFRGVTITASHSETSNGSAIAASYRIEYETLAYDHDTRDSAFVTRSVDGFASLPSDLFDYIMAVKPHAIPATILALAPGDPAQAMAVYQMGMKRGYLTQ